MADICRRVRNLLALIVWCSGSVGALAAHTVALDITQDARKLAVWPNIHVLRTESSQQDAEAVARQLTTLMPQGATLRVDSPERILGRGNTAFWGAFTLHNADFTNRGRLLSLEATTVYDARLYARDRHGLWQPRASWAQRANGAWGGGTIYPVWSLDMEPGTTTDYLLRIEGPSIVRFPVFLYSAEEFELGARTFHVMVGATLGIFLFIGLYIASLRRHLKDASVSLFAVILVADLIGTFWLSGFWSELFPGLSEHVLSPIGFAAYATLFGCGCWHSRLYLTTRQWAPPSDSFLRYLGWCWLLIAPWFAWAYPAAARILLVWGGTATALVVVTVSVRAARRQIRFSGYEAATWAASLLFVMSYLVARAFDQPLLWSSSALALVQATVIAMLYGVGMSQHLLRQKQLLEKSERQAVLQREKVAAHMRERSLIYAATNHDLRQPLLGVGIFADLLKSATTEEDRQRHADKLTLALAEVDDILVSMQQIAALGTEVHPPRHEVVALNDVLAPLIDEYRNRAQIMDMTIRYVPSRVRIRTHVPYFQRIVRNALSNAIRYGFAGGRILVGCRRGGGLRLVIADNGRGMAPLEVAHAFDAYTRFGSHEVPSDGAGLGLFSAQSLAQALQLRLDLQSQGGKGTTLAIKIPPSCRA